MYTTNKEIRKGTFSNRAFFSFVVFGLLLLLFSHSLAQQPIPVNLPDSATGNPGSSILLPITVGDITGRSVRSYTAFVQYDNSVLTATGVDITSTLSAALPPLSIEISDFGQLGTIRVKTVGNEPLTGSGILVNLIFDVIGSPADTTNLGLTFFFNLGSPPAQSFPGKFTINSPNIEISPPSLDFGITFLDSTVERTLQITNSGTFELTINNISISGENPSSFSLVSFTPPVIIASGGTSQVPIQFLPVSVGIKNAILNVDSDDPDEPSVIASLSGVGLVRPEPDITVSPGAIDFGEIFENTVEVRQLEIENVGTARLEINSIFIEEDNQNDFSIVANQFPILIDPDSSATFEVLFSPTSLGQRAAKLVILSNDPDENRSEVELLGFAASQPKPEILVTTDSLDFAATTIDSITIRTFTIKNIGSGDLVISELNLAGPNSNEFEVIGPALPFVVQPQDSEIIEVSFSPNSVGLKTASLQILSNDAINSQTLVSLIGEGKPEDVIVSLNISSIQFDDVFGDSSKSAFFTIKNLGIANLEIFSIETAGANAEDFLIENVTSPFTLTPGDSQIVELVFEPKSTGVRSAIIEIRTNAPGSELISIPVSGVSLPPLLPAIDVSSDTLIFGTLEVEADSSIDLYIRNSGKANLTIDKISIKNQVIPDFLFLAPEQPFEISPGDSQKVTVIFSPNRDGFKTATLEIFSNAPNKPVEEVTLQGSGVLSFFFRSNIVTLNNSVICGDSAAIEVEIFKAGGVAPVEVVCKINDIEFLVFDQNLIVTIPVLSDSFLVQLNCFATDGLGRTRSGQDSIIVLKAKELVCKTKITSPPNGGIAISDSISVLVEHQVSGGKSPRSSECLINGIPAIKKDGVFFAKIPLMFGENLIIATCQTQDDCGSKVICSDSISVTRIETVCDVEIISPEPDKLVCQNNVRIEALVKIPNFVDVFTLTTIIDDEVVQISEDSLFSADISLQSGRNLIVAKAILEFENGQTLECADSIYVSFDNIIPECELWPDAGNIVGTLTDSLSGLANIEILHIQNAHLLIDEFQPGIKQIQFRVVPQNPNHSIVFSMKVTDVCGNFVICDPVYLNLDVEDSGARHVLDFQSIDRFLTIKNNGVEMIRCKLNQKEFVLFTEQIAGRPKTNSFQIAKYGETTFDLTSELKAGINLLEVQLIGYPGASVELFLADQLNGAIDYNLEINSAPQEFSLRPNYPNPFNPSTNIEFEVPVKYTQGVRVKVQIYNILGEVVNNLIDDVRQPGIYRLTWNGTNNSGLKLSSGIYILNMQADGFATQRRILLIK